MATNPNVDLANALFDLADEYLGACYAALGDSPGGQPPVFFVAPGPPPWDCCPMLAVHVGGPVVEPTFPVTPVLASAEIAPGRFGQVNMVSLTATVLRCAPTMHEAGGGLPSGAENNAAATLTLGDVWAIWNHIGSAVRAGTLFSRDSGRRPFLQDAPVAVNQQGGACGWQIPVRVELPGFAPVSV